MKRIFIGLLAAMLLLGGVKTTKADEGMWLPILLKDYDYEKMKKLGLKLTPEQVYSINNSSLKDAIVQLGGFCTAEVVSEQGLLFTNHHCAYDAIQEHSTVENNYLRDGFWAQNKGEELHVPGLSVSFLVKVEDVTDRMMKVKDEAEGNAAMAMYQEMEAIKAEVTEGTKFRAEVKDMFEGNGYYVFVYETFNDIRLVGAPPEAIGKFGGDTDNWMWPRHTGDFSVLRIYAGQDNKPAEYSSDNKPYKPKHHLPISTKGIKDGDFTMIMGYPGSTDRYFTSFEVEEQQNILAPMVVKIMGERLEIMKEQMDKDPAVRIKLASNYASLNNTYKYFKGNLRSLNKFNLAQEKRQEEAEFYKWAQAEKERKALYGTTLSEIGKLVEGHKSLAKLNYTMSFAGFAPGFLSRGIGLYRLKNAMEDAESEEEYQATIDRIKKGLDEDFKEYDAETDMRILGAMMKYLYELPADKRPDAFQSKWYEKAKGDNTAEKCNSYAEKIFKKSMAVSKKKMEKFLKKPKLKKLEKDPGVEFAASILNAYRSHLGAPQQQYNQNLSNLRETYLKGMMEMDTVRRFYPDANFTMRLTYGTVKNYSSWEGEEYNTFTYANQILDKEIPNDDEFHVPAKLHKLIKNKDFGPYGENGKLNVCFLHNTDITGGNSGSPVINGNGELIGIAFDGNWESMMSDLKFQEQYVRTISVDVRYVLFVIDKYAGASHLIDELTLVD